MAGLEDKLEGVRGMLPNLGQQVTVGLVLDAALRHVPPGGTAPRGSGRSTALRMAALALLELDEAEHQRAAIRRYCPPGA